MEAATDCTLFLPKDSDIVKEMLSIGRHHSNMLENHPEQERGSRHKWVFNSMVKATETTLRSRIGELSSADQEQTEALRWLRTTTESTDLQELATWKKACRHLPTCAKPRKPDREWIIFAVEGLITYEWPKQDTDSAQPPFIPLEEPMQTQDGQKRRIRIHDLVRHALVLCGAQAAAGRASRGNLARELSNAIMPDNRQVKGRKGDAPTDSVPVVPDRSVSALTQRLLKRWRNRRQSVSEGNGNQRQLRR